jgi:hypothetical protein
MDEHVVVRVYTCGVRPTRRSDNTLPLWRCRQNLIIDSRPGREDMDLQQVEQLITLIRMEYLEMPDLKLTLRQAVRLWDTPPESCEAALDVLVLSGFLARTRDGAFLRRSSASSVEALVRAS